jgi:DNA (cytosine-5)-methyltransferase 1
VGRVTWAKAVSPRIISLENVAEFVTWGPLDDDGHPIKAHAGETFREFIAQLEQLGYTVEWRVLNAADFGAPTSRKRLFLIARRDGRTIAWPKPTHGPKGSQPYRTAAECIDWSIPVPSIFDRKKPLAEATQRRIAEGIRRYVLEAKRPFLVNLTHGGRVESIDEPFKTVTGAHRGEKALVAPLITKAHSHGWDRGAGPISPADRPLGTVVAKDGTRSLRRR